VLLSWVFVVTRFAHAGIFVTSNDVRQRSLGVVSPACWCCLRCGCIFALKILPADLTARSVPETESFQ